jgi:hypothetical protein
MPAMITNYGARRRSPPAYLTQGEAVEPWWEIGEVLAPLAIAASVARKVPVTREFHAIESPHQPNWDHDPGPPPWTTVSL